MRVLHVISGIEPENGGPTVALCGLARALTSAGVTCEIVSTWKGNSAFAVADSMQAIGVTTTLLGPTRRPFRRHPETQRTLTDAVGRADLVHIHAVWEDIETRAARVANKACVPVVWTPHGMLDTWNMSRNALLKRSVLALRIRSRLNLAAAIHVASPFEQREVARLGLMPPVVVQGFGVDNAAFAHHVPRGSWRAAHGIGDDNKLILYLGRVQRGKGLEHVVPAMARVDRGALLLIAGPDEAGYRKRIEALIKKTGVAHRVHFLGMVTGEDKMSLIRDSDVMVAASEHENFGVAVAESIVLGTPVVVSDQVGLADWIRRHPSAGRVASVAAEPLAQAINSVLAGSNKERCADLRAATDDFAWGRVAGGFCNIYQSAVSRGLQP